MFGPQLDYPDAVEVSIDDKSFFRGRTGLSILMSNLRNLRRRSGYTLTLASFTISAKLARLIPNATRDGRGKVL